MEIGQLYQFILVLVLIGIILGIGILVLSQMSSSITATDAGAAKSLNDTKNALGTISTTWLPIIVLVVAASVIIFLIIRSFGAGMGGRK